MCDYDGYGYGHELGDLGIAPFVPAAGIAVGKALTGLFGGGGGGEIGGVRFGASEYREAQSMLSRAEARPQEIPTIAGNFTRSGKHTYSNDETGRTVSKTPAGAAQKLVQAMGCAIQRTSRQVNTNKAFGSPGGSKYVYQCGGGVSLTAAARSSAVDSSPSVPAYGSPAYPAVAPTAAGLLPPQLATGMPGWLPLAALGAGAILLMRKR